MGGRARAARALGARRRRAARTPTGSTAGGPERRFGEELARVRDSLAAWQLRVPQVRASWEALDHAFAQLGERPRLAADGRRRRPRQAAGGRDAVVHDRVRPRHDHHVPADAPLRARARADGAARARRRSRRARTTRRATPSPGRSSTRCAAGKAAERWFDRYYGTVDATPLFLVLLSEVWRWTDDAALVTELQEPALAALRVDRRVGRPRRRRLRRVRAPRAERARGAVVEGLGRLAALPRRRDREGARSRRARCRATSTTRSVALAEIAREAWRDRALADRLEREAAELQRPLRRGVLGRRARRLLRARARPRQAAGRLAHLEHRAPALVGDRPARARRRDRRPADERAALVGLGRAHDVGRRRRLQPAQLPQRHRLAPRQLPDRVGPRARRAAGRSASGSCAGCSTRPATSTGSCPRCSPASSRAETPFPIAYPTAARPQAWAAGAPVLLLQLLLGLEPDRERHQLDTRRARAAVVGGRRPALGRPRVRPPLGRRRRGRHACGRRRRDEDRGPRAGLVPGAADRLRRDRVGRLAARRRASSTPATT